MLGGLPMRRDHRIAWRLPIVVNSRRRQFRPAACTNVLAGEVAVPGTFQSLVGVFARRIAGLLPCIPEMLRFVAGHAINPHHRDFERLQCPRRILRGADRDLDYGDMEMRMAITNSDAGEGSIPILSLRGNHEHYVYLRFS